MDAHLITALGDELFNALRSRQTLAPLTRRYPQITLEQAYRISLHFLQRREALGEQVIGKKIGVTSRAVQEMLDVHQPDFGFLTNAMQVEDGCDVSLALYNLIQPRAEGEIAFILGEDLQGPGISAEDVLAASQWVVPCFEIVDSRIDDWQIRIQDTVADNASCGVFALGSQHIDPRSLDLAAVHMQMSKSGLAGQYPGRAGHPVPPWRNHSVRCPGAAGACGRRRPYQPVHDRARRSQPALCPVIALPFPGARKT